MAKAYVYNLENEVVEAVLIGTPENALNTFIKTWNIGEKKMLVCEYTLILGELPAGVELMKNFKTIEADGNKAKVSTKSEYELTAGGTLGLRVTHSAPVTCEVCSAECSAYVDGRTNSGMWANMCDACHKKYGSGLGIGRGQRYEKVVQE